MEALKSLESSGGYAILLGMTILGILWLSQRWVDAQAKRGVAREEKARMDFEERLEYERQTAQAYREMLERNSRVIEGNSGVIAAFVETSRTMNDTLMRIEQNISLSASAQNARHS